MSQIQDIYQVDFSRPIHVYFIGIGGISMSGLAEILLSEGFTVSGSDWSRTPLTERLESQGAAVHYGRPQKAENIEDDVELVVYTAAVHPDNPEYQETLRRQLPHLTRAQLLGQMMKNYRLPVAVSGTHGKTTTTSMIAEILVAADTDPTISVVAVSLDNGGNIRVGSSELFVTEACEYTNSFLSFFPRMGIILNVEEDHLDFFKDLDDIRSSFRRFAQLIPKDGLLIINGSIPRLSEITEGLSCRVVTFGPSPENDYFFTDITHDDMARASFTLRFHEKDLPVRLGVPGEHNIANAAAALALADYLGLDMEGAAESLHGFTGTDRRFEYKGELHGVTVIDDYAHHPTEIEATLKAAADYAHGTLWCVFQPHTYSRTKAFFHDFARALSHADRVILADIYAARETDTLGVSSALLCQEIRNLGTDCHYFPSFEEIEKFILENCIPGDLLITMGAGNVVNIGEDLLGQ